VGSSEFRSIQVSPPSHNPPIQLQLASWIYIYMYIYICTYYFIAEKIGPHLISFFEPPRSLLSAYPLHGEPSGDGKSLTLSYGLKLLNMTTTGLTKSGTFCLASKQTRGVQLAHKGLAALKTAHAFQDNFPDFDIN
jgi:hypothetical protein